VGQIGERAEISFEVGAGVKGHQHGNAPQ
jgi:hypothetical protein